MGEVLLISVNIIHLSGAIVVKKQCESGQTGVFMFGFFSLLSGTVDSTAMTFEGQHQGIVR